MSGLAYYILRQQIIASQGEDSLLLRAIGKDWKGRVSPLLYLVAIPAAYWSPWMSQGLYAFAALLWLAPDRRIEKAITSK